MLAELLEHDHGQEARAGPSPRDGMERRRGLADLLAIAAGELLPYRLDHLPLARHYLQRARHVLAELAKAIAAATFTSCRRIDHHPFPWQMLGEGLTLGALACKSTHCRRLRHGPFRRQLVLGGVGFQLFERQRQLLDQPRRTFRPWPIDLMFQLGDLQLLLGDQRFVFRRFRAGDREFSGDLQTLRALDCQRLLQGANVIRNSVAISIHATQ